MTGERTIEVVEPGLLTTVQDLGRPGLARYGVAPGGALDRAALILGNRLVGNEPGAAGLEITLLGPRLRFGTAAVVALTGADLGATVDGERMALWRPVLVGAGAEQEVAFAVDAGGVGARAYLCVAGGIEVAPVMGSRSTDLFGGFGGVEGRALRTDDRLSWGDAIVPAEKLLRRRLAGEPPEVPREARARVVLGPQAERFAEAGVAAFLGSAFTVTPRSDRMGMRLSGPTVEHSRGADMVSEGIAHGAVQVPGDGQPIVLLAARQTVGGYPKIATVVGSDLDALGQLRPGGNVRFAAVEPAKARALTLAYRAGLGEDAVVIGKRPYAGWSAPEGEEGVAEGWTPAGVERVIAALREAGVTAFRLEVAAAGLALKLELRRGADGELAPVADEAAESGDGSAAEADADMVTAPLLGVFYRRSAPDHAPLAEVGQRVAAGQALGLLEVMKTYHEIAAPRAGVVAEFLVEDGQFVEYGQGVVRLQATGGGETD